MVKRRDKQATPVEEEGLGSGTLSCAQRLLKKTIELKAREETASAPSCKLSQQIALCRSPNAILKKLKCRICFVVVVVVFL